MNDSRSAPEAITIRSPREPEWRICRMLLSDAFRHAVPPDCLLAVTPQPPYVVGAVAYHAGPGAIHGVRVRVLRDHRRRGVGRLLMGAVTERAAAHGAARLIGLGDPKTDPEGEAFASALGFVRDCRLTTFECDLELMAQFMSALRDRILSRQKLPAGAEIVWLPEAPKEQVARLHADYIMHNPDYPVGVMAHALENGRLDHSPVLMAGGEVVAMVIWELAGTVALVHARVMTPPYQRGWANPCLMAMALERGREVGVRRVRFESRDDNPDTLKLARRFQSDVLQVRDTYVRILAGERSRHGPGTA